MSLCFTNCRKEMTREEFNSYLEENKELLVKKIKSQDQNIDICYYPNELMLLRMQDESLSRQVSLDSIDYFLARFKGASSQNSSYNFYDAKLVVDSDTLEVLDVLQITNANTTERSFSMLYAFKSYLAKREVSSEKIFFLTNDKTGNSAEFYVKDIRKVQRIHFNSK